MAGGANVKVGIYNLVAIGLMAIIFIVLVKMATAKWPVPGVTPVVQAV